MRHNILKLNIGRIMAVLLAFVFLASAVPVVSAADVSGECGDGVSWAFANGTLTISGEGAMSNYGEFFPAPWVDHKENITVVNVENGVSHIGEFAFFALENLRSVTIAQSVKTIGTYAFYGCTDLKILNLSSGLEEIGAGAFKMCTALTSVRLPETLKTIRAEAFYRCESLLGITIPASVTTLEASTFTYCSSLKSAAVLANVSQLPTWTFYGCYELSAVSICSNITDVGVQAFQDCYVLEIVNYGGSGAEADNVKSELPYTVKDFNSEADVSSGLVVDSNRVETNEEGNTVVTDSTYTETENSSISTDVTHTNGNGEYKVDLKLDATIENENGWKEVKEQLGNAMSNREYGASKEKMEINIQLKGDTVIAGTDLNIFTNKYATVSIYTNQGAKWRFNGEELREKDMKENYDLSFTFEPLTDPDKKQEEVVGKNGFLLKFNSDLNFKVEVHLPVGLNNARMIASFYSPEFRDGYTRMQNSVIDNDGIAHFYLASVKSSSDYLIGISNKTDEDRNGLSEAIVPVEIEGDYPKADYREPIQYVISDVKSSWGLDINQVTLILVGVMVGCILIVGVVVFIIFKSKRKNFYDPYLDGHKK